MPGKAQSEVPAICARPSARPVLCLASLLAALLVWTLASAAPAEAQRGARADLSVRLVGAPDPVGAGAPFHYRLTVGNAGPGPARGVTGDLTLPLSFRGRGLFPPRGCRPLPQSLLPGAALTLRCSLGTVAAGQQVLGRVRSGPRRPRDRPIFTGRAGSAPTRAAQAADGRTLFFTGSLADPGQIGASAIVSSLTPDPRGTNNRAFDSTLVVGGDDGDGGGGDGGGGRDRGGGGGGNDGAPSPTCLGEEPTIVGTDGPDILNGTPGRDVIVGLGGVDKIPGGDGNDLICGGEGDDSIVGDGSFDPGSGNFVQGAGDGGDDTLYGGTGDDHFTGDLTPGEGGDDSIAGGAGNDQLRGDNSGGPAGDDTLDGGAGDDFVLGDNSNDGGDDSIAGGAGDDDLRGDGSVGDGGEDTLDGGAGNDDLVGDSSNANGADDTLDGGAGNDDLRGDGSVGDGGEDTLDGGAGSDSFEGERGDDTLHAADDRPTRRSTAGPTTPRCQVIPVPST